MEAMEFSDEMLAARGLPPIAFIDNTEGLAQTGRKVVAIKRGMPGCYAIVTACTADELNAQRGVTAAQREAMLMGSLFGWHVPGADPKHWEGRPELVRGGVQHGHV